jgi:hypothetical protein
MEFIEFIYPLHFFSVLIVKRTKSLGFTVKKLSQLDLEKKNLKQLLVQSLDLVGVVTESWSNCKFNSCQKSFQKFKPSALKEKVRYGTDLQAYKQNIHLKTQSLFIWRYKGLHGPKKNNRVHRSISLVTLFFSAFGSVLFRNQCCGSGSTGSTCFWASRIRILLSSCKNSKKNLHSYHFVTLFDFLSLKKDVASKSNKQKKLY